MAHAVLRFTGSGSLDSSRTYAGTACSHQHPRQTTHRSVRGARNVSKTQTHLSYKNDEVAIAWQAIHQLRSAYTAENLAAGKKTALAALKSFPKCPIPEIARLGRTLRKWRREFLAYFETGRSSNGGAEAINGLIELHRRVAGTVRRTVFPPTRRPRVGEEGWS
ncbi:transposase, partial [Nostocoides veronense]|uniref:transposase n=1 Tax=Nostocoides veronense TaxID=330836 RepID=UPI0031CFA258